MASQPLTEVAAVTGNALLEMVGVLGVDPELDPVVFTTSETIVIGLGLLALRSQGEFSEVTRTRVESILSKLQTANPQYDEEE